MFGLPGEFLYFECSNCGCIQQCNIAENLSGYYPRNYYSFSPQNRGAAKLKYFFHKKRAAHTFGNHSLIGQLLGKLFGPPIIPNWVRLTGIKLEEKILDVGTGSGNLLYQLSRLGFTQLTGLDPYIESSVQHRNFGITIYKSDIQHHQGYYDLVMFHHSLEHMPDPLTALTAAARLTKPGKYILVRVPVADSYAWRTYGTDWVQFDAPRHIFLHTVKSINILAERSGLILEKVVHDSTAFQFWGSEQNRRNIYLFSNDSYTLNKSLLSADEMQVLARRAAELNQQGDGDQACFYLKRPE